MSITHRNSRPIQDILADLASELGFDEEWMEQQLRMGGEHVQQLLREYVANGIYSARAYARHHWNEYQLRQEQNTDLEHFDRMVRHCDSQNMDINDNYTGCESLSNSPREEQMQPASKKHKSAPVGEEGIAEEPAQIGLDKLVASGPIWTHFPNNQRTRLRYRATIYYGDTSMWTANRTVFTRSNITAATELAGTGGGNVTEAITQNLAQGTTVNQAAQAYDFSVPYLLQLRMTSPYNIIKSLGDTTKSTIISEPNWISMWDGMYQYYVCQETDWGVNLHFGAPVDATAGTQTAGGVTGSPQYYKLKIFYRYTNQDDPPTKWTMGSARNVRSSAWSDNTTTSGGQIATDYATPTSSTAAGVTENLNSDDYEMMGGWKMRTVSWNTTHATSVHLGGKYRFGQCKMDVKTLMPTDAAGTQTTPTAEGMTLTRATPAFPEILSIIIVNDAASNEAKGLACPFTIQIDTNQQIDFADLRAGFKFPTPNLSTQGTYEYTPQQYYKRGALY